MKPGTLLNSLLITVLFFVIHPLLAEEAAPQFTPDGLQLMEDSNLALVYVEPGADMSRYDRILLATPYVAFRKNWQRDQNQLWQNKKVSTDDMEKIKTELAGLFTDVFSRTLSDAGYRLVSDAGDDVLLIRPAIVNLDIVAPDTHSPGITRSYSESAGEMTLYMELYDSVTGDLIAKALDRKRDRRTGYFEWRNKVSNRAAANRILQVWANVLKEGLDDAGVSKTAGR
jgi:hypothetical protein